MDWVDVGWAAVVGGISAGTATLISIKIFGYGKKNRIWYVGLLVLLFFVFNALGNTYLVPYLLKPDTGARMIRELEGLQSYQTIKSYDPEAYQEIISSLATAKEDGLTSDQTLDRTRSVITRLSVQKVPFAPDPVIQSFFQLGQDQLHLLLKRDDDLCFPFLFPQTGGLGDAGKFMDDDMIQEEQAILASVFAQFDPERKIPDLESVQPYILPVYKNLVEKYGDAITDIQNVGAPGVNKRRVCEMTEFIMEAILHLPDEQKSPTLRWFAGQAATNLDE